MRRSPGAVGSLELLAARARAGDRRAAAQLRRRMSPQLRDLSRALSADPRLVPAIVRGALGDALADDRRPYTSALVAAVQRRTAAGRSPAGRSSAGRRAERSAESRLLAAVGVLCDMQGHTHESAAALLDEPVNRVAALHARGRAELGVDGARTHCRGWHLVSRLDDLTPPEQEAGRRHLAACRHCEEALAARAAARLRLKAALPVGGTVIGGGVVALFAAVGGGSAGVGAAAVGAAAVLGTAGTVAVAVPPALPPPAAPAQVAPAEPGPSRSTPAPDGRPPRPTDLPPGTDLALDPAGAPAGEPAAAAPDDPALGPSGGEDAPPGTDPTAAPGPDASPTPPVVAPTPVPPTPPPATPLPPVPTPPAPVPTPTPTPTPPGPVPTSPVPSPTGVPLPLPSELPLLPGATTSPLPLPGPTSLPALHVELLAG